MRNLRGLLEASAGVEPAMADLQLFFHPGFMQIPRKITRLSSVESCTQGITEPR